MKTTVLLVLIALIISRRTHRHRTTKKQNCGEGVTASTRCNIEGISYEKISKCGCKYRGSDCLNYNYFVEPEDATNLVHTFYP